MKKFLVFAVVVGLLITSCDLFPNISYDDIKGEWDFPDRTIQGKAATDVHLSVLDTEAWFDLGWNTSENSYWISCEGTMNKNVFTGTYDAWDNAPNPSIQIDDGSAIVITFSLIDDLLIAEFEGEGLLDGVTLSEGVKL
jgi:hypothetical protein